MHRDSCTSGSGLLRWLAIVSMLAMLLLPSSVHAQGLKDRLKEDEDESTQDYPGLIGETEYESPQFGFTLEWSDDWGPDTWYDDPDNTIQGPAIKSDTENEVDTLYMMWDGGVEWAALILHGQSASGGGPEDDVEDWTDEDYIADKWVDPWVGTPLLDDTTRTSGAVFFSTRNEEQGVQLYTVLQSILLDDGTVIYFSFETLEEHFLEGYESLGTDMLLNGEPIDLVFSTSDLEEAIAED